MNCLVCRGACCEELIVTPSTDGGDATNFPRAFAEFLSVRGVPLDNGGYAVAARCPQLTNAGLCSCYEDRPMVCELFPAGGPECLAALQRRRTPEERERISGGNHPTTAP
jgi:Fe-S-cluster containining protein